MELEGTEFPVSGRHMLEGGETSDDVFDLLFEAADAPRSEDFVETSEQFLLNRALDTRRPLLAVLVSFGTLLDTVGENVAVIVGSLPFS